MRDASTYRSERRNDWAAYHRLYRGIVGTIATWPAFNQPPYDERGMYGTPAPIGLLRRPSRSKYIPHNGKREMARRAARLTA